MKSFLRKICVAENGFDRGEIKYENIKIIKFVEFL